MDSERVKIVKALWALRKAVASLETAVWCLTMVLGAVLLAAALTK